MKYIYNERGETTLPSTRIRIAFTIINDEDVTEFIRTYIFNKTIDDQFKTATVLNSNVPSGGGEP